MGSADEPGRTFVFSFGLEKLGLLALKAPRFIAVLLAIATVAAGIGVSKLQVDDSLSELFRTNTEEFRRYEEIDRRFPSSEYDVLVVVEGKDLLKKPQLEAFRRADRSTCSSPTAWTASFPCCRRAASPTRAATRADRARRPARRARVRRHHPADARQRHRQGQVPVRDGELALAVIALDRKAVQKQGAKKIIGDISKQVDEELGAGRPQRRS